MQLVGQYNAQCAEYAEFCRQRDLGEAGQSDLLFWRGMASEYQHLIPNATHRELTTTDGKPVQAHVGRLGLVSATRPTASDRLLRPNGRSVMPMVLVGILHLPLLLPACTDTVSFQYAYIVPLTGLMCTE